MLSFFNISFIKNYGLKLKLCSVIFIIIKFLILDFFKLYWPE